MFENFLNLICEFASTIVFAMLRKSTICDLCALYNFGMYQRRCQAPGAVKIEEKSLPMKLPNAYIFFSRLIAKSRI